MTTKYNKDIGLLAVLLVVAIAPASMAFAQTEFDFETEDDTKESDKDRQEELREQEQKTREEIKEREQKMREDLREQKQAMREELKERKDAIREKLQESVKLQRIDLKNTDRITDIQNTDRVADLKFNGTTTGWAIIGNTAHIASIDLSGEAYKAGGSTWLIKSVGSIKIGDRDVQLELKGHTRGNMILLHGTGALSDDESIRVHLKGHFAPTDNDNEFALGFTNASVQYLETGIRVPLMQVGSATVMPVVTPVAAQTADEPVVLTPAQ